MAQETSTSLQKACESKPLEEKVKVRQSRRRGRGRPTDWYNVYEMKCWTPRRKQKRQGTFTSQSSSPKKWRVDAVESTAETVQAHIAKCSTAPLVWKTPDMPKRQPDSTCSSSAGPGPQQNWLVQHASVSIDVNGMVREGHNGPVTEVPNGRKEILVTDLIPREEVKPHQLEESSKVTKVECPLVGLAPHEELMPTKLESSGMEFQTGDRQLQERSAKFETAVEDIAMKDSGNPIKGNDTIVGSGDLQNVTPRKSFIARIMEVFTIGLGKKTTKN